MTRVAGILALFVASAVAGTASAQVSLKQIQGRYTPAYGRCMAQPAAKSTLGMLNCVAAETRVQDQRLNAGYARLMRSMTPDERQRLQAAQRAWIAYRDADCAARVDPVQWGSLSRIDGSLCTLNRTVERTFELETFRSSGEG